MRRRKSKYTREMLEPIVAKSECIRDVLRHLGICSTGGSSSFIRDKIDELEIDRSHFMGKKINGRTSLAYDLSELLVENSNYNRTHLKNRLLKEGILKNKCSICDLEEWQGKPLVMVLDHVNGVNNDNRIENLRMLCPNCNSQQPTFAGRKQKQRHYCQKCNKKVSKKNGFCRECVPKKYYRKVKDRPSKDIIIKQINELGYRGTGKIYGVSGNAVKKWVKQK